MKVTTAPILPVPCQVLRRKLKAGESIQGLDELLGSGAIQSFDREKGEVVVYSSDPGAAARLNSLPLNSGASAQARGLLQRAQNFLLPTDLKVSCAPEYLKFRAWSLAGATLSGMLGFMMSSVYLDSVKAAFSTSEKAAMAGVITGSLGKATQMMGWQLSKRGDTDPKKSFLVSSLISSANASVGLGVLAVLPKTNLAYGCATALTGTVAGIVGSAAGVNIFNHMASGPNKGEVATKNSNQDLIAGCLGMPGGVLLNSLGHKLGVNPAILAACTLGPLLILCVTEAAASIRMDAIDRADLEQIIDHQLDQGSLPEAPSQGVVATLQGIFAKSKPPTSNRLELPATLEAAVPVEQQAIFGVLRSEKYLVSTSQGKVRLAVRKDASFEDAFKGFVQARLLERALQARTLDKLTALGDRSPEVTLVRLTYAALPADLPGSEQLAQKGWHPNLANLDVEALDAAWSGPAQPPLPALTMDQFNRCLSDPQALLSWVSSGASK